MENVTLGFRYFTQNDFFLVPFCSCKCSLQFYSCCVVFSSACSWLLCPFLWWVTFLPMPGSVICFGFTPWLLVTLSSSQAVRIFHSYSLLGMILFWCLKDLWHYLQSSSYLSANVADCKSSWKVLAIWQGETQNQTAVAELPCCTNSLFMPFTILHFVFWYFIFIQIQFYILYVQY